MDADQLTAFAEKWDHRYPMISASWLEHWEQITPFLAYPADVRRVIYTTDESVKGGASDLSYVGVLSPCFGGWRGAA